MHIFMLEMQRRCMRWREVREARKGVRVRESTLMEPGIHEPSVSLLQKSHIKETILCKRDL